MGWTMFVLSFFVNFPHFILSYQIFYWDLKPQTILSPRRNIAVGFVIPLAMLGVMVYAGVVQPSLIPRLIQAMFVLVGWHYAKQVYGIIIVSSALDKQYFSRIEKYLLLTSLASAAGTGWIR